MKARKLTMPMLVLLLAMLVLSACQNNGGQTAASTGNAAGQAKSSGNTAKGTAAMNKSGFPIVNSPITLKMFARRSPPNGPYKDMLMFQQYEKMTNIHVNWQDVPDASFTEKKNLIFASNELPDAFFKAGLSPLETEKYGTSGLLIPLEKLIDQYAPNIKKLMDQYPAIKSSITAPDGHIYTLPGIVTLKSGRTAKDWINQTWLNKLQLQAPQTTADLVKVLTAFRDKDPNGNSQPDEIPMSDWNETSLVFDMAGAFGLQKQMGYYINIDRNKVDIWLTDPRYKQELMYLHQLYAQKLIDQKIFSQTGAQYVGKMAAGKLGYFFNQANDPFATHIKDYVGIAPVKGPNGDRMQSANPVARDFGAFAITKNDKYPAATMRWIDYFYGDKGSIFFRYGIEGKTFTFDKDHKPHYTEKILKDPRGTGTTIGQFTPWPGGGSPEWINIDNSTAINPPAVQAAEEKLDPYLPKKIYGAPLLDEATSKEVDNLRQDIDTYVQTTSSKFITGALGFDKWNEYVNTLKKMNLDKLQQIYQKAFDQNNK